MCHEFSKRVKKLHTCKIARLHCSFSNMDKLICNKCFTPIYRGKQPYSIMSCGHISCQSCLPQGKIEESSALTKIGDVKDAKSKLN